MTSRIARMHGSPRVDQSRAPTRRRAGRRLGTALALGLACAMGPSCTAPHLLVEPEPATARVLINGFDRGAGPAFGFMPYYGGYDLAAVPAATDDDGAGHRTGRTAMTIDEPVTPWIFPFDFVGELVLATLTDAAPTLVTADVAAEPREQVLVPAIQPARKQELLLRARTLTTAR